MSPVENDPLAPLDELMERLAGADLEAAAKSWEVAGLPMTAEATRMMEWMSRSIADELQAAISTLRTSIEEERARYREV